MTDIRDLLARLGSPSETRDPPSNYRQPSVSSPVASPSPTGPQPHHPSAVIVSCHSSQLAHEATPVNMNSDTWQSPNTSALNTPAPEPSSSASRAPDLLSLLKFRTNTGLQPVASPSAAQAAASGRPSSTILPSTSSDSQTGHQERPLSEVVASFVRKPSGLSSVQTPSPVPPMASRPELRGEASGSSTNPQNFLLSLLNQASAPVRDTASLKGSIASGQSLPAEMPEAMADNVVQDVKDAVAEDTTLSPVAQRTESRKSSPIRVFGEPTQETSAFEAPAAATKGTVFTYVNPFEQLSASSPHNRTPIPGSRSATPQSENAQRGDSSLKKARKISPEPTSSTPEPTEATPTSADLLQRPETVSEALSEVGEQVHKEVTETLAEVVSKAHGDSVPKSEQAVQEAAVEIKQELKDEETRREMEAAMPKPMAQAFEATIDAVAENDVAADGQRSDTNANEVVRVFNFPMRPFVSIDIKTLDDPPMPVTDKMANDIARLKKDFDQIDRNLVTASQNFIIYTLKDGGFRVIRQDNGDNTEVFAANPREPESRSHSFRGKANNAKIFKGHKERVFNVMMGRSDDKQPNRDTETILGAGVNGSVFWTSLLDFPGDNELPDRDGFEFRGFILPPIPTNDDNQAGSQLKTRVKASSRHATFFGYGRGKSIYIIWPGLARTSEFTNDDRICDTEAYLNHFKLQIHTGKAAKDFAFSADDTVIASLDKVGKLKFWDIRKLTDPSIPMPVSSRSGRREIIKEPIMSLATHVPDQKMWPTSLMFIDKERPMAKGIALRYLVVGMKQNHTLQLWDLSLGKPVQEINFPHEGESDAICSLVYHPKTGILVVGHPTKNTIYLLHVSSPRYNLPPMSQAKFLSMVASKDSSLPTPDSTIIISGIREYALGKRGRLRSLDILDDLTERGPESDSPYFELYAFQAKGVTVISIGRENLGWSKDGKIVNGVDALAEDAISLKPLVQPTQTTASETNSTNGDAPSQVTQSARQNTRTAAKSQLMEATPTPSTPPADVVNGADKTDKKKKKKAVHTSPPAPAFATPSHSKSPAPESAVERQTVAVSEDIEVGIPQWAKEILAIMKSGAASAVGDGNKDTLNGLDKSINTHFNNLYRKINEDRRVMDAAGNAKQDALLRLVSSTLNENIEPTMDRIVSEALEKILLGPVRDFLVQNMDRNLAEAYSQGMKKAIPREIEKTLPTALKSVLQDQMLLAHLTERISQTIDLRLRNTFEAVFEEAFVPAFTNLSMDSGRKIAHEVGRTVNEQLRLAEQKHQQDAAKIDALLKQVHDLQATVTGLMENQNHFQMQLIEVLRQSRELATPDVSRSTASTAQRTPGAVVQQVQKTPEEIEASELIQLLNAREYEQACVKVSPRGGAEHSDVEINNVVDSDVEYDFVEDDDVEGGGVKVGGVRMW